MGGLFGGTAQQSQASQQPAAAGLQIQTSTYGMILPVAFGATKIAPNIYWYGDFYSQIVNTGGTSPGGKGGGTSGGGKGGGGGTTETDYFASVLMGLCAGPIAGVGRIWQSKEETTLAASGFSLLSGNYGQAPWGYLTSAHPDQADPYSGVACIAGNLALGTSASLPNNNVEVFALAYGSSTTGPDADASVVVSTILTHSDIGAGFTRLGDLSLVQSYTLAAGLVISPAYTDQTTAADALAEIADLCNFEFVWSQGLLTAVPYGDAPLAGNGAVYTPPAAPLFDLDDDDFQPYGQGEDPVQLTRKRGSDVYNQVTLEYLDRTNQYAPVPISRQNDAYIQQFGLNAETTTTAHIFGTAAAAQVAANLRLQKQAIANSYRFKTDLRYIVLDPMDLITITDGGLGFTRKWVRVMSITLQDDELEIEVEEYLAGTNSAPLYQITVPDRFAHDFNVAPGAINPPVIFEPPDQLAGGLQVWAAVSGASGNWGGCEVWAATDDVTYRLVDTIKGGARMGVLTAPLVASATGVDDANTLAVDLSQSRAALSSGSAADASSLITLCYVGNAAGAELLAYENADLTGSNRYALTHLIRGAYATANAVHAAGDSFVRLDNGILEIPYDQSQVGATLHLKFLSFNVYGGAKQQLSDVPSYPYKLKGSALLSPLPDVAGLTTVHQAELTLLGWSPVVDFRAVDYEIRYGADPLTGQILGRTPNATSPLQAGDGTYWLAAHSEPLPGIHVYSAAWTEIVVAGAVLVSNVIATFDEGGAGWIGTTTGSLGVVAGALELGTGGAADILADPDFLGTADVLFYGGAAAAGVYTAPAANVVDKGRAVASLVGMSFAAQGVGIHDDVLGNPDFLGISDLLDAGLAANIMVQPQIGLSDDGIAWAWQNWQPGSYSSRFLWARLLVASIDEQTQAIVTSFKWFVDVPDREDVFTAIDCPASGGLAVAFSAGLQGNPAADFNAAPHVQILLLNAQAGDVVVFDQASVTKSGFSVQVKNAGVGVDRALNITAQGY